MEKQSLNFVAIIPARFASTRFPGKPLVLLGGKPLIQWVYEGISSLFEHVYVATDDERIVRTVEGFEGKVIMTSPDHPSGTDRVYEALLKLKGEFDVVVNVQGDEPFVNASQIENLKKSFDKAYIDIATLAVPFPECSSWEDLNDPNVVKVVRKRNGEAMYFSRSVIPYIRNEESDNWPSSHVFLKHMGLYAYRTQVLNQLTKLDVSPLEAAESLEQLRWLENGYRIQVELTDSANVGIDTPEDLDRAEEILKGRGLC